MRSIALRVKDWSDANLIRVHLNGKHDARRERLLGRRVGRAPTKSLNEYPLERRRAVNANARGMAAGFEGDLGIKPLSVGEVEMSSKPLDVGGDALTLTREPATLFGGVPKTFRAC